MASAIYPKFKEYMLDMTLGAGSSPATPSVKAALIDTADYTYSTAHDFWDDVAVAAREEISGALASKTFTDGVFDAADVTFTAAAGDPCEAIIIFIDTGVAGTSRLVAYIDTGTGLPVTLNGGNVTVAWDNGANKIFAL